VRILGLGRPDVERMKASRNINGLIRALHYKKNSQSADDLDIPTTAAFALGELGDNAAVESLIEALDHPSYFVQNAAAIALGRIGDGRAVEPLTRLLSAKDLWVKQTTTEALNRRNNAWDTSPWPLQLLFNHLIVRNALEALRAINDKRSFEAAIIALGICDNSVELVATLKKRGFIDKDSKLNDGLTERISASRLAVVQLLSDLGDSRALSPLRELLACRDKEVQRAASEAIMNISASQPG